MKVLFTGGGTGGHIYPALALARYLRDKQQAKILFVGTEKGMEKQIVPAEGFQLEIIPVVGLQRKVSLQFGRAFYLAASGVLAARRIMKKFQPDVVIGTGGYVAGPVVLAARLLGIPTIIHEQNAIPGLTNIWLSRLASRVCVSIAGSAKYFPRPQKIVLTGNPRATEAALARKLPPPTQPMLDPNRPLLICSGGSLGAAKLNEAFTGCIEHVLASTSAEIVYITGNRYFDDITERLADYIRLFPTRLHVLPYHPQMPQLMARAALMVSRAGATTLAELTALGIPAVLIPSPNVTNNHQEHNARSLSDCGAAILIREDQLTVEGLAVCLVELLSDAKRLTDMAGASKSVGIPDAALRMVSVVSQLADN